MFDHCHDCQKRNPHDILLICKIFSEAINVSCRKIGIVYDALKVITRQKEQETIQASGIS
jgi:hypothetical protein